MVENFKFFSLTRTSKGVLLLQILLYLRIYENFLFDFCSFQVLICGLRRLHRAFVYATEVSPLEISD